MRVVEGPINERPTLVPGSPSGADMRTRAASSTTRLRAVLLSGVPCRSQTRQRRDPEAGA